jgi:hypothetical protein
MPRLPGKPLLPQEDGPIEVMVPLEADQVDRDRDHHREQDAADDRPRDGDD